MQELEAMVLLSMVPSLKVSMLRDILDGFGSAATFFQQTQKEWRRRLPIFKESIFNFLYNLFQSQAWKKPYLWLIEKRASLISYFSTLYPVNLKELVHPPPFLYVQGETKLNDKQQIALIGTRHPSEAAAEKAYRLGRDLAKMGWTVVSGLAKGIDTAAHQGALDGGGKTIAVMGTGIDTIYPAENLSLAEQIERQGSLLSEYPLFTAADRYHFPQRNRIVSSLSQAVVLIEAPRKKSGAMHTMQLAEQQGKPRFSLASLAAGNHFLTQSRKAISVESAQEIESWIKSRPEEKQLSIFDGIVGV